MKDAEVLLLKYEATRFLRLNYENGTIPLTDPDRIDELKKTEKKLLISYKILLKQILGL